MNKRYLIATFLVISFILLAGTIFHWLYKDHTSRIRTGRIKEAYALASQIAQNAAETGSFAPVTPLLGHYFQRNAAVLLVAVKDSAGQLHFLKTRLLPGRIQPRLTTLAKKSPQKLSTADGTLQDRRKLPSSFHYSVSLDREKKGSLLLYLDPASFTRVKNLNLRRFYTAAIIILLTGALVLILLSRLQPTEATTAYNDDADYETEPSTNMEYRELDYLKNRNTLLEHEIESLAQYRENSILATSVSSVAELVDQLLTGLEKIHGTLAVRIYIDANHLTHSLEHESRETRVISSARLNRLLVALPTLDLQNRGKSAFPLEAGKIVYGLIVLQKQPAESPVQKDALHNTARLIGQAAVSLYNFILYETAVTDALTGLFNRRHFDTRLREEFDRCTRYGNSLALVLIDIDHFKNCNDTWGHQTGDRVLQDMASLIRRSIRKTDFAFRYGGEEIAILLPETDVEQAADAMETLREKIAAHPFRTAVANNDTIFALTCSFGVSAVNPEINADPTELTTLADKALYFSKKNGRNMVSRRMSFPSAES